MTPAFLPEDIVYLKTDPEMLTRMVTGYKVSKNYISYELVCGVCVSWHYDYEITKENPNKPNSPGFGKQ